MNKEQETMEEKKTKVYFASKGLALTKILEAEEKTPDYKGENIIVEVKKIALASRKGLYPDPTFNNIKNKLKDTTRQFRTYDPNHNNKHIVVIFCDDMDMIKEDIPSVWTGEWSPDNSVRPFKGGMLLSNSHKKYIDEIIWFENVDDPQPKCIWEVKK